MLSSSYIKKPAFGPHGFVGRLVIKVHYFHLNIHSVRHALLDGHGISLVNQLLREYTGKSGLTTTVRGSILREARDQTEL